MNDQEHNLIQAARNGDQAAFGELVRQYQKRVFALAVRRSWRRRRRRRHSSPRGRVCPFFGGIPPLPHGSTG